MRTLITSRAGDDRPIVFYDGECGLCNRSVQFILDHDSEGRVLLAPLQGETFRSRCARMGPPDLKSIVLLDGDQIYQRSGAVFHILRRLPGPWRLLGVVGLLVPRPLRDRAYDFVAARRYRWFGPAQACRLPSPHERARLLP